VTGNVWVTVEGTETRERAGGVRVSGYWTKNGEPSPTYPDEGVTDLGVSPGDAWITSDPMRGVKSMRFCVTGLSGEGYVTTAVDPPECSSGEDPPVDPPPSNNPTLTAQAKTKGKIRVNLSWENLAASAVDVVRNPGGTIAAAISNTGSYTDRDVATGVMYTYQVCDAAEPAMCTNQASATP
jgi:hypothetical protein